MFGITQGPDDLIRIDNTQAVGAAAQPDGSLLAIPYQNHDLEATNTVLIWDVRAKRQVRILQGVGDDVRDVAFSPDGTRLACAGQHLPFGALEWAIDGEVKLWSTRTWKCLRTTDLSAPLQSLGSVAFSPDGAWLAVGSAVHGGEDHVGILDAASGRLRRVFGVVQSDVAALSFSPDGRRLAGASSPEVAVWDTATGEARWSHKAHRGCNLCLAFAPDGLTLASSGDRTTAIWDAATGERIRFLKGHEGDVRALAFSPDGRVLATGSHDGVRLWDVRTAKAMASLATEACRSPVWIGFWPDSSILTAVDYALQIIQWDLSGIPGKSAPQRRTRPTARDRKGAELLAAITKTPEDDAVRLIYADWLEENGHSENDRVRAEFIRARCEVELLLGKPWPHTEDQERRMATLNKRVQQLLAAHREEWLEPLAPIRAQIDEAEFRRGLLWGLSMTGSGVADEHLAALRAAPELEELNLDESAVTEAGLAHLLPLVNLRDLRLCGTGVTVAGLAPLGDLKKLVRVYQSDWGNEPNAELEAFKEVRNSRFLGLPARERRGEALAALRILANPFRPDEAGLVRELSFSQSWTTDADLIYLRELPELEDLDFYEDGAVTMAGLAHLQGLKKLKRLRLGRSGVTDLGPLRHLTGLEELDVSSLTGLDQESLRHLRPLKKLCKLNLMFCEFGDAIMPHLGRLAALEELEMIYNNEVTDEGLEQLASLENLERLDVDDEVRRADLIRLLLRGDARK
jgi:uncharacterized protein (TIGR02996 family)